MKFRYSMKTGLCGRNPESSVINRRSRVPFSVSFRRFILFDAARLDLVFRFLDDRHAHPQRIRI
jgi:hypothetical protein